MDRQMCIISLQGYIGVLASVATNAIVLVSL